MMDIKKNIRKEIFKKQNIPDDDEGFKEAVDEAIEKTAEAMLEDFEKEIQIVTRQPLEVPEAICVQDSNCFIVGYKRFKKKWNIKGDSK